MKALLYQQTPLPGLGERAQSLEDLQSRLAEMEDNMADCRQSLTRWEDKLAAHMDMGTAARDPKHIDKIKVGFGRLFFFSLETETGFSQI